MGKLKIAIILLVIGFHLFTVNDAFAIGENNHVQFQFCFFSGGGAVLNDELTGIVEAYGKYAMNRLNAEDTSYPRC